MLKKGQRVKINSGRNEYAGIFDGRIGIVMEDDVKTNSTIYHNIYVHTDVGNALYINPSYLTPVEPSIDNLMVGDVVVDEDVNEYTISFIGNDNFIALGSTIFSKKELKDNRFKITPYSPKPTMTLKEAEEKLNVKIIE